MRPKILAARCYQWLMTLMGSSRIKLSKARPNAVVMLVPDYGNIGDLAIGYAQEEFLTDLDTFEVQSVPIRDTYRVLRHLRRDLRPQDVVLLVGGGSMGDLYPRAQLGREFISRYLRAHRMVSFPQSIIYMPGPQEASSKKREATALSRSAQSLTLFARERQSLEYMKSFYPGEVGYAPDIVLSLAPRFQAAKPLERSGVLLALRADNERALSDRDHQVIREAVVPYGSIIDRDHGVPNEDVSRSSPYSLPLSTLDLYRRTSVVVTDRLHGMIFAAITGTPCVVLANTNHKITGTYHDWIASQCSFVRLVPRAETSELVEALRDVTSHDARQSYQEMRFDFADLRDAVLGRA